MQENAAEQIARNHLGRARVKSAVQNGAKRARLHVGGKKGK
jgi:hypothetical protein